MKVLVLLEELRELYEKYGNLECYLNYEYQGLPTYMGIVDVRLVNTDEDHSNYVHFPLIKLESQ